MAQCLIYHPYKSHSTILLFAICLCVVCFICVGIFITQNMLFSIFFLLLGIEVLICVKYLSRTADISVIFTPDGLIITMGKENPYTFVSWESIHYAYYAKNFKGFHFLLLSSRTLNSNQVQKYVLEGTLGKNIYQDLVVIIHLASTPEGASIPQIVSQHGIKIVE